MVHACMCRPWLKAWKLHCPEERPGQHTASEGASHERRARGLAETAGAGLRVSSETVPTENPRCCQYLDHSYLEERFSRFHNMYHWCIAVRIYTVSTAAVRKTNNRLYDHPTQTLTKSNANRWPVPGCCGLRRLLSWFAWYGMLRVGNPRTLGTVCTEHNQLGGSLGTPTWGHGYFAQLGAWCEVHQEGKRNGFLAIELEKHLNLPE